MFTASLPPLLPYINTKKTTRSLTPPQLLTQLPLTSCVTLNLTSLLNLLRNHVNNALSGPYTPLSASTAVASAPLSYDNFSSARLLKFCQHAIPTFLTLCHNPSGSATSNTTSNSVYILVPLLPSRCPHTTKKELPEELRRTNTPTDRQEFVPIRLRIRLHCWHYTATRMTLSLVPYYYLHRQ